VKKEEKNLKVENNGCVFVGMTGTLGELKKEFPKKLNTSEKGDRGQWNGTMSFYNNLKNRLKDLGKTEVPIKIGVKTKGRTKKSWGNNRFGILRGVIYKVSGGGIRKVLF